MENERNRRWALACLVVVLVPVLWVWLHVVPRGKVQADYDRITKSLPPADAEVILGGRTRNIRDILHGDLGYEWDEGSYTIRLWFHDSFNDGCLYTTKKLKYVPAWWARLFGDTECKQLDCQWLPALRTGPGSHHMVFPTPSKQPVR